MFEPISFTNRDRITQALSEVNKSVSQIDADMGEAYVTLCTPNYFFGLIGLHNSLRATGDRRPLIVLTDVEWTYKERVGWENAHFIPIPKIVNPDYNPGRSEFAQVLSKFWAFGLEPIGKLVFLDSDMIIRNAIGELFAHDGLWFAPDYVESTNTHRFNTGLFVCQPSAALFSQIIAALRDSESYDGGDQGHLNNILHNQARLLPAEYNVTRHFYAYSGVEIDQSKAKVLHYIVKKPWQLKYSEPPDMMMLDLDDVWTSYLDRDELLLLIKKWRRETFFLYERERSFSLRGILYDRIVTKGGQLIRLAKYAVVALAVLVTIYTAMLLALFWRAFS